MEPHPDRLLRPVDKHHVEQLKLAMKVNPSTDAAPIVGLVVLKEGKIFIPWNTHDTVLLHYIQCHAFLQEKCSKKARRSATITKRWVVTTPEPHFRLYAKRRQPPTQLSGQDLCQCILDSLMKRHNVWLPYITTLPLCNIK